MKYLNQIDKVRLDTGGVVPFFRSVSLRHKVIVDDSIPSLGANDGKGNIYLSKAFFDLPRPEQVFIYWHELEHWFRNHFTRMQGRNPRLWNVATDYQINYDMSQHIETLPASVARKVSRPAFGLYDKELAHNRSAEMIYHKLLKDGASVPQNRKQIVNIFQGGSEEEIREMEADHSRTVERVIAAAEQAGKLPKYMEKLVPPSRTKAKIPVERYLTKQLVRGTSGKATYTRPNSRRSLYGVIAPSIKQETNDCIDLIIDTSGSMWRGIPKVIKALNTVKDITGKTVRVIQVDTGVRDVKEYPAGTRIKDFKIRGGGGTSFVPGFSEVRKRTTDVLYYTDGYCHDFPKRPKSKNVIWLITKGGHSNFRPPFGKVIYLYV